MILYRTIELSQGVFKENIKEITKNTDIVKFSYNEEKFYGLIEKVKPNVELKIIAKEIYKILKTNGPLEQTEAKGFTDFSDYKIFLYGEKNEFIDKVIVKTIEPTKDEDSTDGIDTDETVNKVRVEFDELKTIGFELDYEFINNIPHFSVGDIALTKATPIIGLSTEISEIFEVEIRDIDCSETQGLLQFKDNTLTLVTPEVLLEEFPVDTYAQKSLPISVTCVIDGKEKIFNTDIEIGICNKKQIKSNFEDSKLDSECLFTAVADVDNKATFVSEDIGFLANAIFEIDEKLSLIQEQLDLPNTVSFSESLGDGKGVKFMAEMWARWIQTGRRTFDQCPKQYQEEVKALLADIGLDENGKPLVVKTK